MNRIFYITRSYHPYDDGGGALMRKWAVEHLTKLGWEVTVVRPNYGENKSTISGNVYSTAVGRFYSQKLYSAFERIGIIEDYLDDWIINAVRTLAPIINPQDIVFATSGGELSTIKLASILKKETGCRYVANFRDPLNYGFMRGLRRDNKFHVGREKLQDKYLKNVDLIITSSKQYADILTDGFPQHHSKIFHNYFGYGTNAGANRSYCRKCDGYTNIVYAGNLSATQAPEVIFDVLRNRAASKLKLTFIGDTLKNNYDLLNVAAKIEFVPTLSHDSFISYMQRYADIGLVSLSRKYYGACVPSKLYEYLALGLPILGFLPPGDAFDIINDNGFGIATEYGNIATSYQAVRNLLNEDRRASFRKNITDRRVEWSMEHRILEVDTLLRSLHVTA